MERRGARTRLAAVLGSLLGAAVLGAAFWAWSAANRHDPVQVLQELPLHSVVHLAGVVTYIDQPGKRFWIEDETAAIPLPLPLDPVQAGILVGSTVQIDAIKTARYDPNQGLASVRLQQIRIAPSSRPVHLPAPVPVALAEFPRPEKNGVRVQIDAVLRAVRVDSHGQAHLFIANRGRDVELVIARPDRDFSKMIDSQIRIVGLPEQIRNAQGALILDRLWSPAGSDLQVEDPAPDVVPLVDIRSLYLASHTRRGHEVRLEGQVAAIYADSILLEGRWGSIQCNGANADLLPAGRRVEVTGFPRLDGLEVNLVHARVTQLLEGKTGSEGTDHPAAELKTVAAVRGLPADRAAQALPVSLTGVVTYIDNGLRQLFLQDATGGIYVKYSGDDSKLAAGSRVSLTGITSAGDYAPVIVAPEFRITGEAPLPAPEPVTLEKSASGSLDSRYVTIEGVVHPMRLREEPQHSALAFDLFTSVGPVHVYTSPLFPGLEQSRSLEDARVRIRGVFGTVFNARRQLVGYQLLVEKWPDVEVLEPGAPDPFAAAATPIADLLRFSPNARFGHRVKVEGTVTLAGRDFLYLQDATDGVEIRGDASGFRAGDRLEAIGYPTLAGRYSPVIADAEFRLTGHAGVVPKSVTADSVLQGHQDSLLVTVQGRLLTRVRTPARETLVLQSGMRTFTAQLDTSEQGVNPLPLRRGSVLRLTGVASTQVDPSQLYRILEEDPTSFQILLRSPGDVGILRRASVWTMETTLSLLTLLSPVIFAILVWVILLRRRVRRQMADLRRAADTARAIRDLSVAMQNVSREQRFDTEVSVRGSEAIAQLVVGFNRMLVELQQREKAKQEAEARLQHMALIDELTGLPNRRLLAERLSHCLARARREQRMLALLYIDLDGFKLVNDSLGHAVGDQLLSQVSHRLKARFRESDTLARLGGDEFTLILDGVHEPGDAERAAESLLEVLQPPFEIESHPIRITASVGISLFPNHGNEAGQLLQQADCAMYAAKRNGKNRVVQFGDHLGHAARERLTLEGELRRALADKDIFTHYQPEFDLASQTIVRFEALARWTHPRMGNIPPLSFIPVAEESGLIVPLGAYIMERACRDAVEWQRYAGRPIQVAVNVSSVQFARDSFVEEVEDILHRTGLPPSLLQIELTESATLTGVERAAEMMRRLKSKGISVAMDDFGTGYSCLSYLPKLSFDALKLDRSFVNELIVRPETRGFVKSILMLAHNLNMKVIVEGIETREQLELIRALGTNEAQGYFLGRPSANPMEYLRKPTVLDGVSREKLAEDLETVR
ncbi:MAG TPA: EAL domain-containing protein [Acidobacteriaceae bacterium]|jgi:diguanylate cyclase (GGDEF)-like protein|nr:EAL domain-containing protein [Acidobacteriaceae bacterium]